MCVASHILCIPVLLNRQWRCLLVCHFSLFKTVFLSFFLCDSFTFRRKRNIFPFPIFFFPFFPLKEYHRLLLSARKSIDTDRCAFVFFFLLEGTEKVKKSIQIMLKPWVKISFQLYSFIPFFIDDSFPIFPNIPSEMIELKLCFGELICLFISIENGIDFKFPYTTKWWSLGVSERT